MDDPKWWDEKNQGNRTLINHKGLMPLCKTCRAKFKLVKSDKPEFPSKAEHPANGCPFWKKVYGKDDLDCVMQLRG